MPRFPPAEQICWRDTVHESRMCLLPQGYWPALQIFVEAARTTPPTHEAQCALSPSATIGPVSRHLSGSFVSPRQSVRASDDAIREHIGMALHHRRHREERTMLSSWDERCPSAGPSRSEEHTSDLQSLMRIS